MKKIKSCFECKNCIRESFTNDNYICRISKDTIILDTFAHLCSKYKKQGGK